MAVALRMTNAEIPAQLFIGMLEVIDVAHWSVLEMFSFSCVAAVFC